MENLDLFQKIMWNLFHESGTQEILTVYIFKNYNLILLRKNYIYIYILDYSARNNVLKFSSEYKYDHVVLIKNIYFKSVLGINKPF